MVEQTTEQTFVALVIIFSGLSGGSWANGHEVSKGSLEGDKRAKTEAGFKLFGKAGPRDMSKALASWQSGVGP